MRLTAIAATLLAAGTASAHFAFLLPDGSDKAKLVFSDGLKPDANGVPVDKVAATKLALFGDKRTDLPLKLDKDGNFYAVAVPGSGPRVVSGETDYGVFQREKMKPMWLKYYPKLILGAVPAGDAAVAGVAVELVPIIKDGKLKFKALANGKPVGKAEVSVLVPARRRPRRSRPTRMA